MSEMVERVARAIWQESVGRAEWYKWKTFRPDAWGRCLSMAQARAAIEAMREPTETMEEAARYAEGAHAIYTTMIDETLK